MKSIIGLIGDVHGGIVWDGISRFDEQRTILEGILHFAKDMDWTDAMFLGDVCDSPRPTPEVIAYFLGLFRRFGAQGQRVWLLRGNHDGSEEMRGGHALLPMEHSEPVTVLDNATYVPDIFALCLPHGAFGYGAGEPSGPLWGFCHHDLDGATVGSEGRMLRGGKSPLLPALRDHPEIIHWFAGHIHKPQEVGPRITVVGSIIQMDRGEAGEEKRIITLYPDRKQGTSHPLYDLGACCFDTRTLDYVDDLDATRAEYNRLMTKEAVVKRTLLEVKVRLLPGQTFDATGLERHLRGLPLVKHLRRIVPEVIIPEARRIPEVTVEKAPRVVVEEFVNATVPEAERPAVLMTALDCLGRSA